MPILTVEYGDEVRRIPFGGTPTVRTVLEEAGISPAHPCGGRGVCGQCAADIRGALFPPTEREKELGKRLSCQTRLKGDARIILRRTAGERTEILTDETEAYFVRNPLQRERVQNSQPKDTFFEGDITAVADIGTTTLALSLYEGNAERPFYSAGDVNPQVSVAADVIGRIHEAEERGTAFLQRSVSEALTALAEEGLKSQKRETLPPSVKEKLKSQAREILPASAEKEMHHGLAGDITQWIVTGNTTMLYLYTGRNPSCLGRYPFMPDHCFDETIIRPDTGAPVYLPPCVHGFLGADLLCAVLASGMTEKKETALLCDLGTNGEMALWKDGVLYAASAAMGPALEGVGIRQGCPARTGAIDQVSASGFGPAAHTIGGGRAVGICGSGVVDAVACGLDLGLIETDGRMERRMALRDGIGLEQEDVQAVLMAKAAAAAGLETLLQVSHTEVDEIGEAWLCGGFGCRMNLISAARIGLWPGALIRRTRTGGNAALKGAALLRSEDAREKIRFLAKALRQVPLGGNAAFEKAFIRQMRFASDHTS